MDAKSVPYGDIKMKKLFLLGVLAALIFSSSCGVYGRPETPQGSEYPRFYPAE